MAENIVNIEAGSTPKFTVRAGTPGPAGPAGPEGPQGDPGILVLGLADPVPGATPEDTLIVRYDQT